MTNKEIQVLATRVINLQLQLRRIKNSNVTQKEKIENQISQIMHSLSFTQMLELNDNVAKYFNNI